MYLLKRFFYHYCIYEKCFYSIISDLKSQTYSFIINRFKYTCMWIRIYMHPKNICLNLLTKLLKIKFLNILKLSTATEFGAYILCIQKNLKNYSYCFRNLKANTKFYIILLGNSLIRQILNKSEISVSSKFPFQREYCLCLLITNYFIC